MRSLILFLIFLLLGLSQAVHSSDRFNAIIPAYSKGAVSPTSDLVEKILLKQKNSQTYHEWIDSEYFPLNVFSDLKKQELNKLQIKDLCLSLSQLDDEDLSAFYRALTETDLGPSLPCSLKLTFRINKFWNKAQDNLNLRPFKSEDLYFESRLLMDDKTFGPSEEKIISTIGGPVFISGDLAPGEIAFTFDDGPHSQLTEELLHILYNENLQATFFMVGQNVKNHPQIADAVLENNHSIGNHSWSHKHLPSLTDAGAQTEIVQGLVAINEILGLITPFFRFPYGAKTNYTKTYLKQKDTSAFYWNMDTLDWKIKNPENLYDYAIDQVESAGGGIILFHDVQPQTIVMMPAFLRELKARKFKPVVFRAGDQ